MKFPAPWLIFSVLVHGILGSFGELLDVMINRLSTPLSNFYNESMHRHYGYFIDSSEANVITSIFENFAIFGSIIAVIFLIPRMDTWGRKTISVYFCASVGIVAALLIIAAKSFEAFELFAIAQIFCGFIRTLKVGVAKVYISECAPDDTRGLVTQGIGTCSYILVIISGILTLPFGFGNDERWHWQAGWALVIALSFMILASFIPESPKFKYIQGKDPKIIKQTIKRFHGKNVDADHILHEYEMELSSIQTIEAEPYESLWSDLGLRESLFLVIFAAIVPAFGPMQLFNLYSNPIQIRFGFSNSQALLFDTISSLFYTPLSFLLPYLYEKVGRRPIFLLGALFGAAASVILFLAEILVTIHGPSRYTVTLSVMFTVFVELSYALGVDVFFILLIADLFPANAKVTATQAVVLIQAVASISVNFGYASFQDSLGTYIYFPFIYVQLFCFFYLYRNLPETRQLPVYENFEQIRSQAVTRANTRRQSVVERPRFLSFQYGTIQNSSNNNNFEQFRKRKDTNDLIV